MGRRVVVTGMGALTAIGNNVEEFWEGLRNGKNGIDFITHFDTAEHRVKVAGELKNYDPSVALDKKDQKRMGMFTQFAVVAAAEAINDSNIDLEKIDSERFGVVIGSGVGGIEIIEEQVIKMYEKGVNKAAPLFIPLTIGNMAAGQVAIKFGARGICESIVTACATSTSCIGSGFRNIKHGYSDLILAGGCEATITSGTIGGFAALKALSTSDDPNRASIPFDKERNGFVMGEGAGILLLEEYEHAKARGAKIYAEVVGYGATCDAHHMTAPLEDGDGACRAMKMAVEEANISANDILYINAHGTSTKANDKGETLAIKKAFGDHAKDISISSTKSMTGHLLGATGAVESIATIKALENGFIPPTIGYKVKDEECDLDYTPNIGKNRDIKYALSNTLGFGGHNTSICFKKWED